MSGFTDTSAVRHGGPDTVHRYVAGMLTAGERDAFERHLLGCAQCQADVRDGSAIRTALIAEPGIGGGSGRPFVRAVWALWAVPIAAAAALLFALFPRNDALRDLGRVSDLPRFVPMVVRSAATEADRQLDSAMAAYGRGDYARAHQMLSDVAPDARTTAISLYAGAAALGAGDATAAVRSLQFVVRQSDEGGIAGASSYAGDAHYLLAKAWLQLGAPDSAEAILAQAPDDRARALRDSVTALRKR